MIQDGSRVQVTNRSLDWYGQLGTVIVTDRYDQVWVRLDGHGYHQALPFTERDLAAGKGPSPLVYRCEPTLNEFVPYHGCTGPVMV